MVKFFTTALHGNCTISALSSGEWRVVIKVAKL
jgi:hypothetical protein